MSNESAARLYELLEIERTDEEVRLKSEIMRELKALSLMPFVDQSTRDEIEDLIREYGE